MYIGIRYDIWKYRHVLDLLILFDKKQNKTKQNKNKQKTPENKNILQTQADTCNTTFLRSALMISRTEKEQILLSILFGYGGNANWGMFLLL